MQDTDPAATFPITPLALALLRSQCNVATLMPVVTQDFAMSSQRSDWRHELTVWNLRGQQMSKRSRSIYFVHTLLRARDWQDRPQFDQVCGWWRDGGQGVCALVGMGGAGKTAIADRFLSELLDDTSTTRKRVRQSASIFVYSFYADDKPESFFRHLQFWLEGTSVPDKEKSPAQLMFDIQQHQGLIILDGLEKVQQSGARSGFGQLTSPSLRDLLNHIACGATRELSVLVTSRFPLTDLRDNQPRFFHTIAVDQIDLPAGVALLRDRGVRGTDMQLALIVEHCGRHALTVDLAGGYIKEYGHGAPATPLNLGTAEELQSEAEQEPDDDKRAVLKQSIRFARIAQRYREAMQANDESALALLERICLFRLGVDCETLAAIFTGPDAEEVSGKALACLDADQLTKKLDWLVKMQLVEGSKRHGGRSRRASRDAIVLYNVHPAVREGFLKCVDPRIRLYCHDAIRRAIIALLPSSISTKDGEIDFPQYLDETPAQEYPSDDTTLSRLEELVYHAKHADRGEDAVRVYWQTIGNWKNLGTVLAAYERGLRICQVLEPEHVVRLDSHPDEFPDYCALLFNEMGLYLSHLGQTALAKKHYEVAAQLRFRSGSPENGLAALGNLADLQIGCGYLRIAQCYARDLIERLNQYCLRETEESRHRNVAARILALTNLFTGHVDVTYGDGVVDDPKDNPELSIFPLYLGMLHQRLGKPKWAGAVLDAFEAVSIQRRTRNRFDEPKSMVVRADVAQGQRDFDSAEQLLTKAYEWGSRTNDKDLLCFCLEVRARTELGKHDRLTETTPRSDRHDKLLTTAAASLAEGLKMARDCGYGLYHIDLLLERARLHLLRGDAGAALDDIDVALETGIPANEETGQVELLAASHEECGYAWAIPAGLQMRAEALLLQAAQTLRQASYVPAKINELPDNIREVIHQSEHLLHEALNRWHDLRDPAPTQDNNFALHGKEFNYRAKETHQVLVQLENGILTRYPVVSSIPGETADSTSETDQKMEVTAASSPRVFISYTHDSDSHKNRVLELANRLRNDGIESHLDQYILNPPDGWPLWMDREIEAADFVLIVSTEWYATKANERQRSGGRFESVLILQDLYDSGMSNDKFIPVVFDSADAQHIPKWIKQVNHYNVATNGGYDSLLRRLLDDPAIVAPPIGTPVKKGPENP